MALAILNGTIGDYLAATGNELATPMEFVDHGRPVAIEREALARAHPRATPRVVVLVHGSMCTESIWAFPGGDDYGVLLARDFDYTPLYLRYNTGLAIADNGVALARTLSQLIDAYPVPIDELLLLGYSMGGLVIRSACHEARLQGDRWLSRVRRAIYLGTPHLGSPFERGGRVVAKLLRAVNDPYARLVSDIVSLRSEGIQDLGDADLRREDRAQRSPGLRLGDWRHPVPLLPEIEHYLVAGALANAPWVRALFGDAVVTVRSATAGAVAVGATFPPGRLKIVPGLSHLALAHHPDVYAPIRAWCEAAS